MIQRKLDLSSEYSYIRYARFSSKEQNKRSCAQQFDVIDNEIARQKLPWNELKSYQDDAKSGRLVLRRPGLMAMLRDLRTRALKPDLMLLDTRERLGRVDEVSDIRKELQQEYGVIIVTADTHFADPTTPQGRIHTVFEEERGIEENRVKSHQVLRGKKDAVRRKRWPGGKPPRGLKLENVFVNVNGQQEQDGAILVEDPDWSPRIKTLFERAADTGEGQTRLANFYNASPEIPEHQKPLTASAIGVMLDNELYIGEFHYPKVCTDIVKDMHVREPTDPSEIIVVKDFCPAIITRDVWDQVQAIRNPRRDGPRKRRSKEIEGEKLIHPLSPGISVRHLLCGLVRCAICGASMRPNGASRLADPSGKYVYFRCPRSIDGICSNTQSIPENWLNELVVSLIKQSLFGK